MNHAAEFTTTASISGYERRAGVMGVVCVRGVGQRYWAERRASGGDFELVWCGFFGGRPLQPLPEGGVFVSGAEAG